MVINDVEDWRCWGSPVDFLKCNNYVCSEWKHYTWYFAVWLSYLGLIGSLTKRKKFEKRLKLNGFSEKDMETLTCPIGIGEVSGKHPREIAISVVAQLLSLGLTQTKEISEVLGDRKAHISWLSFNDPLWPDSYRLYASLFSRVIWKPKCSDTFLRRKGVIKDK